MLGIPYGWGNIHFSQSLQGDVSGGEKVTLESPYAFGGIVYGMWWWWTVVKTSCADALGQRRTSLEGRVTTLAQYA